MLDNISMEKADAPEERSLRNEAPPGPKARLVFGNLICWLRDPLAFYTRNAREFGDVVRARIAPGLVSYQLYHPEHIEKVLRHDHRHFRKDCFTRQLSSILGQSLLTSEGDDWRRLRRLAQPAFAGNEIQHYGLTMTEFTERLLQSWQNEEKCNIHHDMMRLTLEIVAKALFDIDIRGKAGAIGDALETIMDYFGNMLNWAPFLRALPTPKNFRFRGARRSLDRIISEMIAKRRQDRTAWQSGDMKECDLLSRLIAAKDEDAGQLTDRQLRDLTMTLILAGHETTALVLSFSFYLLAEHPGVLDRVASELDTVLDGGLPLAEDVPQLIYTEWVVREAMRLYPPAWGIGREALVDVEIGGYAIPKGSLVEMVPWVVHRDPRWFENPDEFLPERWDKDLVRRLPRGAYFPFGDGPRICIGNNFAMLEAVLILATVLQRFRIAPAPGYQLKLLPSVTLRPKKGVEVVVQERR